MEVTVGGCDKRGAARASCCQYIAWMELVWTSAKYICCNSDALVSLVIEPTPAGREDILEVNKNLNRLLDLETVRVRINNDIHQKVSDTISFDGQPYSVGLPWKTGHEPVPSNYGNAIVRLKSQLNKLKHLKCWSSMTALSMNS